MIIPIVAYGDPVLKKVAYEIDEDYADLNQLIDNMFETMYNAKGVGLAAPQIGLGIRLFIVDASPFAEDDEEGEPDPRSAGLMEAYSEEEDEFEEGCLSLPDLHDKVVRPSAIQVRYLDETLKEHVREADGLLARVMQHEIDHLQGIYFFERLSPIRRTLVGGKLKRIARGDIEPAYPVFPNT